jgi:hypothetical protein
MTKVKRVGRRRAQFRDDLKNRSCWKVTKEAKDGKRWKLQIINRT